MDTQAQNKRVLEALQRGEEITSLGCSRWSPPIMRLSGRIFDLRHGVYDGTHYDIEERKEKNASGKGYHGVYRLIAKAPGALFPLPAPKPTSNAELWAKY